MTGLRLFAGIDTSNYTTSICVIDETGVIVAQRRRLLDVPPGERGLMQSRALFQHVTRLPDLLADVSGEVVRQASAAIAAVGVSEAPRRVDNSYMPVFHAGVLAAVAYAAGCQARLVRTTHQAGHVAVGLWTAGLEPEPDEPFLVLHLSGGTTDALLARADLIDFGIEIVATSVDLHVGQFVDRVGVALGLPFPAGPHLEELAARWRGEAPTIPSAVMAGNPSFSGPLSAALRLIAAGYPGPAVAAAVERTIATAIEKVIRAVQIRTNVRRVLLVGGVASNRAIRARLVSRFGEEEGPRRLYFCDPLYATDNAYGVALIARSRSL